MNGSVAIRSREEQIRIVVRNGIIVVEYFAPILQGRLETLQGIWRFIFLQTITIEKGISGRDELLTYEAAFHKNQTTGPPSRLMPRLVAALQSLAKASQTPYT